MKAVRSVVLLMLASLAATTLLPLHAQTPYVEVNDGVGTLQGWYNSSTGLYNSPAGWWNSANSITLLANYERVAGNWGYSSAFSSTFTNAQNTHANFENNYYDDTAWWGLAWIDAYDLTGDSSYLSMAETMFSYETSGWTTSECGGGGMIWNTTSTYQNAITNELFLTWAAKLANRTTGSASMTYLNWANDEWNWFKASGMINSNNLINDGLKSPTNGCGNNGGTEWTYNQGVILDGLVELSHANNDPSLLTEAETIANAVLNPANGLVNANGILIESTVGSSDNDQFKGIFVRNMMDLYKAANYYLPYEQFIVNNANSIWSNDQTTGYKFGALWQGPVDAEDDVRQTSADEALVAALAAEGRQTAGPIVENGFGSLEMFAYDVGGNVWHNWQNRGNGGLIGPSYWAGWHEFGMSGHVATGGPAAVMDSTYRQIVFIPTSGDVFYTWEGNPAGAWSSWTDMGSSSSGLTGLVAINSGANGGLYVFGRNASGSIYYANKANPNAAWSSFTQLSGASVQAGFTAAENAETGYVEVFGVDSGGTAWTNTQTGLTTWSGWTSLPGETLQGYLTACQNISGHLQIWGIDTRNTTVWTNWQSTDGGSWQSSWQGHGNVGGGVTIKPGFVCGQNANGNLQVLGVGSNGSLYSIWQAPGWTTTWANIGYPSGQPLNPYLIVNTSSDGRVVVLGVSTVSPYSIYGIWESGSNTYGTWVAWGNWSGGGYKFYAGQP